MRRRKNTVPPFNHTFWKADGKLWYVERIDLENALKVAGHSEDFLRRRLGAGYQHILDALEGKRLDGWSVKHIEWGLEPEVDQASLPPLHSWPPRN